MKKFLIFTLLILLSLGVGAQRRRRVKATPTPEELAEQKRQERYEQKLQMTARITFIDSLIVKKDSLMDIISISAENGSIRPCAGFHGMVEQDTLDCTMFRTQLGDKIIFAQPDDNAVLHLFSSELIGDKWSEKVMLPGLKDTVSQNYPFMLSDGTTLYYASKGEESLGGYDIFMTRWDADAQRFLKPENIGMPFNSTGNDYLYLIDEFHQLGWFATDRGLGPDSVCIYTFIPTQTRKIYDTHSIGRDTLVAYANINSIRDTWTDKDEVSAAIKRLDEVKHSVRKARKAGIHFVVNDKIIYTELSQFRTKEGYDLAQKWLGMSQQLKSLSAELESQRQQYSSSTSEKKKTLKSIIASNEQRQEKLLDAIHKMEKEIRSFEQR